MADLAGARDGTTRRRAEHRRDVQEGDEEGDLILTIDFGYNGPEFRCGVDEKITRCIIEITFETFVL